jgi:hypothetical protein
MEKAKRDWVRKEMIARLRQNREGRLTPSQWLSITGEPLTTVLLLLAPALLILGLRLPFLAARLWLIIPIIILILGAMLLFRARRYARAPLYAHHLRAAQQPFIRRLFGQTALLHNKDGIEYRFSRWLAPQIPLHPDREYLIYSLEDGNQRVICSAIPTDDPEAAQFHPSPEFQRRLERRQAAGV